MDKNTFTFKEIFQKVKNALQANVPEIERKRKKNTEKSKRKNQSSKLIFIRRDNKWAGKVQKKINKLLKYSHWLVICTWMRSKPLISISKSWVLIEILLYFHGKNDSLIVWGN